MIPFSELQIVEPTVAPILDKKNVGKYDQNRSMLLSTESVCEGQSSLKNHQILKITCCSKNNLIVEAHYCQILLSLFSEKFYTISH